MSTPPVSVLILTQDEEINLPRCLAALAWCDDIVVVDSGSSDRTLDIAREAGCRILERPFDSFAGQRNFGLEQGEYKYPWVLHLDADELMTAELLAEMNSVLSATNFDAFRIPSKTMFMGRWLKHSGMYPVYQVRLTRLGPFRFKQVGHGQKEDLDPSRIGTLQNAYLHYSFSKGLDDWFARHNRYSSDEAQETLKVLESGKIDLSGFFSGESSRRRASLKGVACYLPFRPQLRFLYMYLFRLGFLDGSSGLAYCRLLAIYEAMIVLKVKQLRQK